MRAIALAALLAVAPAAALPSPKIVATDLDTGVVVLCRPALEDLTLAYTHSMYGGEVREVFVGGDDGRLRRLEMTTANAAAAEYYAYDGRVLLDADGFRVVVAPLTLDTLPVVLDRVGQHRLRFTDTEVALTEAGDEPVQATLDVGSTPFVARALTSTC